MVRPASDDPPRPDGGGAPEGAAPEGRPGDLTDRAGDLAEAELAGLSEAYAAQFAEIDRTLSVYEGFGLLPVETPSPDVARALAGWLTRQGYDVHALMPGPDDWPELVAWLLTLRTEARSVVVVIGPREIDRPVRSALRLLNQRRDSVANHLRRPLLWCGDRAFHEATWDLAPDFWSIREIPIAVAAPLSLSLPPASMDGPPIERAESPERLEALLSSAKATGDALNAARIQLRLALSYYPPGDYARAEALAREALVVLQSAGAPGHLDAARCHEMLGDLARIVQNYTESEASYHAALAIFETFGDRHGAARITAKMGNIAYERNDPIVARTRYEQALATYRELGDRVGEADTLWARGVLRSKEGDWTGAAMDYGEALKIFQALNDWRGQAKVLLDRRQLRQRQGDLTGAQQDKDEVLKIYAAVRTALRPSS